MNNIIQKEETVIKYVVLAKEYDVKKQRIVNKYYFTNTQQEAEEAKKNFDDFYEAPIVLEFKFSKIWMRQVEAAKVLFYKKTSATMKMVTDILLFAKGNPFVQAIKTAYLQQEGLL